MASFNYRNGQLYAEQIPCQQLAQDYGTPCYVYSRQQLEHNWRAFSDNLAGHPHLICYAVKANSNLAVLNILARLGSGFDIVSQGELERVLAAGGDADKIVFSGVGKNSTEIKRALEVGVHCFNVESEAELQRIASIAQSCQQAAPISLRVNPDVDAGTHPYISTGLKENKFGIAISDAERLYQYAAEHPYLTVLGIDCHIGSQITETAPFVDALERVLALVDRLEASGITLAHMDLGGGLGVAYQDEQPPAIADYLQTLRQALAGRPQTLILEPGRAIAADAGILLTQVEYLKPTDAKHFAIVDAAMNDLMRPALYSAWQAVLPVQPRDGTPQDYDIVGPICETGDFLAKQRALNLQPADLLAISHAGAYGFAMASNYNSRNRVAEIMVDGDHSYLVRQREEYAQQYALESVLPDA